MDVSGDEDGIYRGVSVNLWWMGLMPIAMLGKFKIKKIM